MEFHLHPRQGSREENHTQYRSSIDTTCDCCLVKMAFILKTARKHKDGAIAFMAVPGELNSLAIIKKPSDEPLIIDSSS